MAATIQSLVSETKRNRLSLIGPLTEDGVLRVWEKVAQFVEALMLQQKVSNNQPQSLHMFTRHSRTSSYIALGCRIHNIASSRPVWIIWSF